MPSTMSVGVPRDGGEAQRRAEHPPRDAEQEERRRHEGEHEVLHHVAGEQVEIADVVHRTVEGQEHRDESGGEAQLLERGRALGRVGGAVHPGAPLIEREEREQADHRAPMHGETALGQVDVRMEEEDWHFGDTLARAGGSVQSRE